MPTSAAGNKTRPHGFTLLELLVVLAIMAIATAGVSLALRDGGASAMQREGERLAAILEAARSQSRASGLTVLWQAQPQGFRLLGLPNVSNNSANPNTTAPTPWLHPGVQVSGRQPLWLGPEPLIGAQQVTLTHPDYPGHAVRIATDGLRPFSVRPDSAPSP